MCSPSLLFVSVLKNNYILEIFFLWRFFRFYFSFENFIFLLFLCLLLSPLAINLNKGSLKISISLFCSLSLSLCLCVHDSALFVFLLIASGLSVSPVFLSLFIPVFHVLTIQSFSW